MDARPAHAAVLVLLFALLGAALTGCGNDDAGGADPAAPQDEEADTTTTTQASVEDAAPEGSEAVDTSVQKLCGSIDEEELSPLFSDELQEVDESDQGDDPSCAFASTLTADGDIDPQAGSLVTVVHTPVERQDDTVAGDATGGLPELEDLPELPDGISVAAHRTENEYYDSFESWAFVVVEDGLIRIHARDQSWDERDEAIDAVVDILDALELT